MTGPGGAGGDLAAAVTEIAGDIPPGHAMTYGDIAAILGVGPRQIGQIMAGGGSSRPWWRVTNARGELPEPLRAEAFAHYREEGTPLRAGRVDLTLARWRPR